MTGPTNRLLSKKTRGRGERLVLVHGFTQTGASWDRIGAALANRYEVLTVDLPGHGGSGAIDVEDLAEAAELLGATAGRATYIGYSLGGRVCLHLGLSQPDLVSRLVLVGATPGIADDLERTARRAADDALAARIETLELDAFYDEWLAQPLFAHLSKEQADRPARAHNTSRGLASSLRSMGTGTQQVPKSKLAMLDMPVLLLAGANDEKFSAIARAMAGEIGPNASVELVKASGHAVPFEVPEAFCSILLSWLEA